MSQGRVLVIEDDAKTLETIALYLAREGFTFAGAADGPSGLAAARAKPPDLVVLDLMLPGSTASRSAASFAASRRFPSSC